MSIRPVGLVLACFFLILIKSHDLFQSFLNLQGPSPRFQDISFEQCLGRCYIILNITVEQVEMNECVSTLCMNQEYLEFEIFSLKLGQQNVSSNSYTSNKIHVDVQ